MPAHVVEAVACFGLRAAEGKEVLGVLLALPRQAVIRGRHGSGVAFAANGDVLVEHEVAGGLAVF